MSLIKKSFQMSYLLAVLFILSILSACSNSTPAAIPEPTLVSEPTQEIPSATQTPASTATLQPKAVLVGFAETASRQSSEVQESIQKLATDSGMLLEQYPDLSAVQVDGGVQILVVSSSIQGIGDFASQHPSIKFLVIGDTDLQPGPNIYLVNPQGDKADQRGFIAGYLASVITQDWRVGAITQSGSEAGEAVRTGFSNGVVFYCGLCRPVYPPFYTYPVFSDLPANSSQEGQQAAADLLINSAVETVYVEGSIGDTWLLDYLAQAGLKIIGDQAPSSAAQGQWAASLQVNLGEALALAWESILAGETGAIISAPLMAVDTNEQILTSGRLRLVEQTLEALNNGLIDTGYRSGLDG